MVIKLVVKKEGKRPDSTSWWPLADGQGQKCWWPWIVFSLGLGNKVLRNPYFGRFHLYINQVMRVYRIVAEEGEEAEIYVLTLFKLNGSTDKWIDGRTDR